VHIKVNVAGPEEAYSMVGSGHWTMTRASAVAANRPALAAAVLAKATIDVAVDAIEGRRHGFIATCLEDSLASGATPLTTSVLLMPVLRSLGALLSPRLSRRAV
jgi:hypothetical protein